MATSPSAGPPKMIAHWPIAEAICGPRGLFGSRLNGLRPCGRHQTCCLSVMCIRPYAFPCQGSVAPRIILAASLIRRTARVRVASRKRLLAETGLLRRTESSFSSPHKTHTLREAFVQNIDFLCRCRRRGDQLLCGDEPMYRPTDSMAAPAITWRKG